MNCTIDIQTIATKEAYRYLEAQANLIAPEPKPAHVPQRKARYSDRTRVRRQDVRGWVLHRTGAQNTQEIKAALKKLGRKLDLRLSAAWMEINLNLVDAIAQVIKQDRAQSLVGKKVTIREYSARLAYLEAWSPFVVRAISGTDALLEWVEVPIPLNHLEAA
ncbi:MAG: hypothetical protein ACRCZS_08745 [Chroococcidiopsis sp.]